MDFQQVEASNIIVPPPVSIHVMVVDDDATSLAVISNLLKTLNYEVASFKDPIHALYTLRGGKQSFDLILTALYMPKMDGFELTKRVNDEFKLPVIMISTDDRESVMFKAIQEGVVLYLLKPFSPNDLRNIWQFVITTKSRSKPNPNMFIEETASHGVEFQAVAVHSVSSLNEVLLVKKKDSKGKGGKKDKRNHKKELTTTTKKTAKTKVVWTDFLQYRFLQAVQYIGLEKAVPKKILEVMSVPGLTRENVASHLQKYRIFLRKVAEKCRIACDKKTEEVLWSKFLSHHASFVLERIQRKRIFDLNSSENPNIPHFSTHQSSNPNNGDRQSARRPSGFAMDLFPYGLGQTENFANFLSSLAMNQNNAQDFNFSGSAQFQNLALFENSYQGSSFSSNNNNYCTGFSVGVGGEISMAPTVISNGFDGNYVGFDGMGMGSFRGSEAMQRDDQFGQYGFGFGGDNSYNCGLMCNNGINFGGDFQISTVRHSGHALGNKEYGGQEDSGFFASSLFPVMSSVDNSVPNQQQGSGGFMKDQSHQLYNIYTADEESPTTDPFSLDDKVLDEFMASLLGNDTSAEG